jgi:hypothetical protein
VFLSFGGFGGNDSATMTFTDVPTLLMLDGDAGSDKVSLTYRGVPEDSSVVADLGEGRNAFQLDARANTADLPGFAPGTLDVQVTGGEGGNATKLAFSHVFAMVNVDTGAGNDSTSVTFDALPVGETALVSVDMGDGGNTFQILANGLPPAGPPAGARGAVALSLNGGIGNDAATMSFFDVFVIATATLGDGANSASLLLDAPVSLANGGAGTVGVNLLSVLGGVGTDRFSLTLGSPAGAAGAVAALGSVVASLAPAAETTRSPSRSGATSRSGRTSRPPSPRARATTCSASRRARSSPTARCGWPPTRGPASTPSTAWSWPT